ncbi:MAG: glycogen/starch synthase [Patescibacteria group bacterium]|nr:glycogen/starch synthase [Patescibacteria group bacterium]
MTSSVLDQLQSIVSPQGGEDLRILMVAPECTPYANVGGFSRVLGYLSRELRGLGVDARVFMPKFGQIDEDKYKMEMVLEGLEVPTGVEGGERDVLVCNVKKHQAPGGAPVYFLENMEYYEKRANVYGYSDDPVRWALLSRGALEFLRHNDGARFPADRDWLPHVIHCNDWETGHIPNYLRTVYGNDPRLQGIATIFTIHNLQYQGMFDHRNVSELDYDDGRSAIAPFFSDRLPKQNFMRRGIIYSDVVNTVSKTYAKEILTPEYGEGLDRLLLEVRSKLFGVLNGIDYDEFNPKTDKLIEENYDIRSLSKRVENKLALQEEFDLPQDEDIFVTGFVGRLADQKGLDLIFKTFWPFLKNFDAQFVQVGGGDGHCIETLKKMKKDFPDKIGIHPMANFTLPRLIFSGSDVMLFPSKFEPCGITQLEAMRYGSIPIAREVGGLADTVRDFDSKTGKGTGFTFKGYDKWEFFAQVVRAYETFHYSEVWRGLMRQAMQADFSWTASAKGYIDLYQKAIHFRRQDLVSEGVISPDEV